MATAGAASLFASGWFHRPLSPIAPKPCSLLCLRHAIGQATMAGAERCRRRRNRHRQRLSSPLPSLYLSLCLPLTLWLTPFLLQVWRIGMNAVEPVNEVRCSHSACNRSPFIWDENSSRAILCLESDTSSPVYFCFWLSRRETNFPLLLGLITKGKSLSSSVRSSAGEKYGRDSHYHLTANSPSSRTPSPWVELSFPLRLWLNFILPISLSYYSRLWLDSAKDPEREKFHSSIFCLSLLC